jgi:hypothetical protein
MSVCVCVCVHVCARVRVCACVCVRVFQSNNIYISSSIFGDHYYLTIVKSELCNTLIFDICINNKKIAVLRFGSAKLKNISRANFPLYFGSTFSKKKKRAILLQLCERCRCCSRCRCRCRYHVDHTFFLFLNGLPSYLDTTIL